MTQIRAGLHNHTTMCDGKNSAREMAEAALAAGFTDFGFSGHGHTPFDLSYSLKDEAGYIREIRALQKEYAGRIRLYCGLEQDYFAPTARRESYDYIIGSVHYWRDEASGRYWAVDGSPETVADCRDVLFGGDARKMVEAYYALVADNCEAYRPDVAGHLDVVGKNNRDMRFFDENATWYLDAAFAAIDRVCATGAVIELNTNGWPKRGMCYPAPRLLEYIRRAGGKMTINADAHRVENVALHFDWAVEALKRAGFGGVWVWENGRFVFQEW